MADQQPTIQEALSTYDRHADHELIQLAEQERAEVVKRFPLDAWPTMPLERYALGLGKREESFGWSLEFGATHIGSMRGGAARKHIIYRQNDGQWFYNRQAYKDEQQAWEAVRAGFLEAFSRAESGDWDTIDEIEAIRWGPALRTKSLHCYFPISCFQSHLSPMCGIF